MIQSKIVVIGGGFAAVKCARTLRKALPREYFSCFSSVKKHMVFHPIPADVSTYVPSVADFSFGGRLFSLGQGSGRASMRHDHLSGARRDPDYAASGRRRSPLG